MGIATELIEIDTVVFFVSPKGQYVVIAGWGH